MTDLPDGLGNGFDRELGLTYLEVTPDGGCAQLQITDKLLQPYGIVHGGVHTGIIEAACSTGAAIVAMSRGQSVVGLENHTSFLRAVRSGTLHAVAKPLTRGRKTQVWEAVVTNDAGRTCATGRVRLLCLDAGSELAGEAAGVR